MFEKICFVSFLLHCFEAALMVFWVFSTALQARVEKKRITRKDFPKRNEPYENAVDYE
jgi:hypothetical protein